ncbi:MAG: hypothetical protein QOG01_347 [Pseudonocardiales bacterium]|nr:hypothetical protein [Pseudonocardiales bacterium]
MSDRRPSCFISYCHDDVEPAYLDAVTAWLRDAGQDQIEIYCDRALGVGRDLNNFMHLLQEVDAVVILMTPNYKRKVVDRVPGGANHEYEQILGRYRQVDAARRSPGSTGDKDSVTDNFAIIPILFSGAHHSAVLPEFEHIKYLDMCRFRLAERRGAKVIPEDVRRLFDADINEIASTILAVNTQRSDRYLRDYDELFRALFLDRKADWQQVSDQPWLVKTYAYEKVLRQDGFFAVGRKGSGKSTLAGMMAAQHKDLYKGTIPIIANQAILEIAYSFLLRDRLASDLRHVFPRSVVFKFAWAIMFHVGTMDLLLQQHELGHLSETQRQHVSSIEKFMDDAFPTRHALDSETYTYTYYVWSLERVVSLIDECIRSARGDERYFHSDIAARFSLRNALDYAFGSDALHDLMEILATCHKRILITLDGLDSGFDEFRKNSIIRQAEDLTERSLFEIDWLRSLLGYVVEVKQNHKAENAFTAVVDFCLTVPKDRFLDVESVERDAYIYQDRLIELNWTGIELAIMVRKRLEHILNERTDRNLNPEGRLAEMVKQFAPNVPETITFKVGGKDYELPLYLYLLRHTFWRPRDVLHYYAKIFAVAKDMRRRHHDMTSDVVRRIVKDTTHHIISTEYLGEFRSTFTNIDKVLSEFSGSVQPLSFKALQEILDRVPFRLAHRTEPVYDFVEKLTFLYEIGFIGFEVNERIRNRFGINADDAFCFNEGSMPLKVVGTPLMQESRYAIHPIFAEYLQLDTSKQDLVLNLTWGYLREMESVLHVG